MDAVRALSPGLPHFHEMLKTMWKDSAGGDGLVGQQAGKAGGRNSAMRECL